ncbi:scarecrow-like protein 11 [Impatiens glandulifera]|uniref:scarecrow-like protein 11 n=1 Tax=Impatiens glandulifera TaxID=253017 RepID=UPI001FB0526D|nr:scarecrow-like protein 11 [Impatiens glandulifera]
MNRYESLYFDVNPAIQGMFSSNYCSLSPRGNFSSDMLKYINNVLMEEDDLEDKACPPIHDSTLTAAEQSLCDVLYDRQPLLHHSSFNSQNSSNLFEPSMVSDLNSCQSNHVWLPLVDDKLPEFQYGMISNSESSFNLMEGDFRVSCNKDRLVTHGESVDVEINSYRGKRVLLPENLIRVRKTLDREEEDEMEEMRCNKMLASSSATQEELILHDMFDKMLVLWGGENDCSPVNETLKSIYSRKGSSKREAVDTRSLLIQCVQAIGCNDQNCAIKLLKQIRHRCSLVGDGTQRLAHYFANALEARLANSGFPGYKNVVEKDKTFSDTAVIKALELFLSKFPTVVTSYLFASDMIISLNDNKSTSIHILHFGIVHGLQWLPFIQTLSGRVGGPPKLRITGIDIPQSGFRPAARVEETGRRLASYCERFGVPFEYNAIAAKWETLSVSDFKIKEDETVVVNCLYQFMYLQDDTVSKDSPRDAVLKLIRTINPDLFIHGVLNGAFSSPFFVSRFRDALFHFSAFFDMYDAIVERDNQERLILERELLGKEILNVVACEGLERIVRPETVKQWQSRTLRAGFKQVPVGKGTVKKLKSMVISNYHKDFMIEVSNQWVLQGWKGRVLFALSCWKPA